MINPFHIINNISEDREIKFTKQEIEEFYNPYLTLKWLSRFEDCISVVDELNNFKNPLGKFEHFSYLFYSLRKRRRFMKSNKSSKNNIEDLKLVQRYYEYNIERAKEIYEVLKEEDLKEIKNYYKDSKITKMKL